ncbi:SIR2 family protein [Bacillus rhizoplanae]|uniref:SIR2 family protein n=1 Tax=Bacillus rhizoplanae TaxID=2880966 RepID=UPI003D1D6E42
MNIPLLLIEDINNGECVPFIGAGFSKNGIFDKNFTIPIWDDLIELMCKKLNRNFDEVEKNAESYLDIAHDYETQFTRLGLLKFLIDSFPLELMKPGYAHFLIQELNFESIITTNYDDLLEKIYKENEKKVEPIVKYSQLQLYEPNKDITKIIKMHGDFNNIEQIIFTKKDYLEFFTKNEFIADYIKQIFRSKSLLLIGYSAIDPDYNQIVNYRNRLEQFSKRIYIVNYDKNSEELTYSIDSNNICNIRLGGLHLNYKSALILFLRELLNSVNRLKNVQEPYQQINETNYIGLPSKFISNPPASDDEIRNFENIYGVRLPNSYRKFLYKSNGGIIFDKERKIEVLGTNRKITDSPEYPNKDKVAMEYRFIPIHCTPIAEDWWIYWCLDTHDYYTAEECSIVKLEVFNNEVSYKKVYKNFNEFLFNPENRWGVSSE